MTGAYFIRHRGRVRGPFSLDDLRHLREQGRLPSDLEVSEDGQEPFYPIATLAYLFEERPAAPAAPATPRPRVQPVRASDRAAGGPRRRDRTDPRSVEPAAPDREAPAPASARGSGGGGGHVTALLLAVGAGVLLGVALQKDTWGTLAASVPVKKGGRIQVRRTLGAGSVRSEFDVGAAELLPSEQKGLKRLSDLPVAYGATEGFDDSTRRLFIGAITPEQIRSTGRIALAIMLFLGIGSALGGGGAAIGMSQGSAPRLFAMGALLLGLAGIASVVAFGKTGVIGVLASGRDGAFETGVSFHFAAGSGVLLLLAGLFLASAPKRSRHTRGRRSVFAS